MRGGILGVPVVALAFEFDFHGGSMGMPSAKSSVGQRPSLWRKAAAYLFLRIRWRQNAGSPHLADANGKDPAVIERLKGQGIPYISVLTDPIYGGVPRLCAVGRHQYRRARRSRWFRRAEHH